jgi:Rrf2 family iron-sulfur cluster assembly transcriptional regulator
MQLYGKMAANAVAAMSYLAEAYGPDKRPVATLDIVQAREISRPLVGKILTTLSQEGLVVGSPGPKGGFALAKPPGEISLYTIVREFDRVDRPVSCPFGPSWCGNHAPCPLHDQLVTFYEQAREFLEKTSLDVFSKTSKTDRKGRT